MRILLLAPHPYYQDRGTPIAVDLMLRGLSGRGYAVDVLTYAEGSTPAYPGVRIHRIPALPGLRHVRPGLSGKKLLCDFLMLCRLPGLVRRCQPQIIHAVEEGVFLALLVRKLTRIPYVYDMDSSMAEQIVQQHRWLRPLAWCLSACERAAARQALAVLPVCEALAATARGYGARRVFVLKDVSTLSAYGGAGPALQLREELGITGVCFMYVGNLEHYQGIDLLLASFARFRQAGGEGAVVVVGGNAESIAGYRRRATQLGVGGAVHFLGPRPVAALGSLVACADVLVSPRTTGANTPMKIYAYLDSGRALLATDLPTHTQVLTPALALLAPPEPEAFAAAMLRLAREPALRADLAARAKAYAQAEHSLTAYNRTLNRIWDEIEQALGLPAASPAGSGGTDANRR